ncbi:MAG: diacylglycerol/polyprenol kinase family protein [Pseudobdellovibrionaceae bacterium]
MDLNKSNTLKKRSDIHWARKIWHMGTVLTMALIYGLAPESFSVGLLIFFGLLFIPLDLLRQKKEKLNRTLVSLFRGVIRAHEVHKIAGTTYLILGVSIVLLFFPKPIVLLTLLFLAIADPMASYFGIRFGKDKIFGHKSVQGFAAAFVACTVISFAYFYWNNLMLDRIYIVALLAGLSGAVAELVPIGKLDDNLTLPVLSALFLWVIFSLFGGLSVYV